MITFVQNCYYNCKWGVESYRLAWRRLGKPSPFGTEIYTNLKQLSKSDLVYKKIFHGTHAEFLKDQYLKGEFENSGKNIYFTSIPELAAYYVKDAKNPVLLELASPGPAKVDTLYYEKYFPARGPQPQKVIIVKAWKVSDAYLRSLFHQHEYPELPWNRKVALLAKEALKALKENRS